MAGRYYITKLAGKVPAGELYLALDASDKSKVTEFHLLRYKREFCANDAFVAALEAEVAVELSLAHAQILRIHDFGTWEGLCFLVYEKFASASLRELLAAQAEAGGGTDPLVVAAVAAQLLDVLIYTHGIPEATGGRKAAVFQAGFSPECVDLDGGGSLKARGFLRAGGVARPNFLDMALGRMPYLAPAIWEGGAPTARTDLWSLGALLFELITGQPPPKGGAQVAGLRADLPRELEQFVARLLGSDAPFSTAAEAKAGLEKALFTLGLKAGPGDLAAWHRGLLRQGVKPIKEAKESQRNVIAEVVASRRLLSAAAAEAEAKAHPVEVSEAPEAPRREEPKPQAPATTWEKSATYREAPSSEEEDRAAARALKIKTALHFAGAAGLVLALAAGCWLAWYIYLREPPLPEGGFEAASRPRELQAVLAFEGGGVVTVQGVRNDPKLAFGAPGTGFACEFLVAPDDDAPASTSEGEFSDRHNYVQCPAGPDSQKFVRVATKEEAPRRSNSVPRRASLSWRQLLGPDLLKTRVAWIYRYSCDRTFVEGEGVSKNGEVSCPPSQTLNLLHATYYYYTRWTEEERRSADPVPVATDSVCGLASYSAWRCLDNNKQLLFGLYSREEAPFTLPVSLMRAPVGENLMSVVGYAAEPDASGLCPVGLVKARQWTATPPTIAPGEEGGVHSTFLNDTGELSNRAIEGQEPKPFVITRQKARNPCDGKGSCAFVSYDEPVTAHRSGYAPGGELCVIPSSMEQALLGDETRGTGGGVTEKPTVATVHVKTKLTDYEVLVNGQKVPVKNNSFPVRLRQDLSIEVYKPGFRRVKVKLPALLTTESQQIEAEAVEVPLGEVDLATFPPADATFWLGEEKIFSGQTPVNEKLPAGNYRVRLVNTKIGADVEIQLRIQEGKTTSVDQLLKGTK